MTTTNTHEPGSKLLVLWMQPLIGNPYNGYINPYYWVDEFIPYYMEMSWELIDPIAHIRFVHVSHSHCESAKD